MPCLILLVRQQKTATQYILSSLNHTSQPRPAERRHLNPKLHWIKSRLPGKLAVSARPRGGDWLEDEVEGWRKAGIDAVVSLLTSQESKEMHLQEEASLSRAHGIRFLSLPIEDRGFPDSLSEAVSVVATLNEMLTRGTNAPSTAAMESGTPV